MMRKKIITLGFLIGWMIFIFYMSHQPAEVSSAQSDFVLRIVEKLGVIIDPKYIDIATTLIRKGAHVTEYAILGIFSYNVFILFYNKRQAVLVAILVTIGYAITDEVHQLFVIGRAGRVTDVLIDSVGAFIGTGISIFYNRIKLNKSE
ncbi:MAG: VanZ family protein [Clostridium sp.]